MDIVALFCEIDDFCRHFEPRMAAQQLTVGRRQRATTMHLSEVMTIVVLFHLQGYRNFKQFYLEHVCEHLRSEFPHRVSYTRFVDCSERRCYHWVPICVIAMVAAPGFRSLIRPRSPSATTDASRLTASLPKRPLAAKAAPAGSTALSSTWSSTTVASCSPAV